MNIINSFSVGVVDMFYMMNNFINFVLFEYYVREPKS